MVTQDFQRIYYSTFWRGKSFLLHEPLGLWKKDLPPVQKIWLPVLSNKSDQRRVHGMCPVAGSEKRS